MSDFSFVPLRPFFCAALAKRWKVQFRQGFTYINNNVDSKRHIIIRTAIYIHRYIYRRNKPKVLGSNPSECHIFYLFRCALSFSATLAKCWKVQFRLGLAMDSTTLILLTVYLYQKNIILYIYIYTYIVH